MSAHQQPLFSGSCKKFITNIFLLVALSISASAFADPSHYRITGNGGWGHFKLGNNATNLWGPKISPAVGQSTIELTLNGNGVTDWDLLAIKSGDSSVILGDHINGQPSGFFTVSIPLSAFDANAFTNISNMSVPFARGPDSIDLSVAKVAFTGGATPFVWYGDDLHLDNAYSTNWDVSYVAGDGTTEPTDSDNDGSPDATDNCPNTANADQADNDNDGLGNVCDSTPNGPIVVITDTDGDTVPDSQDNCPTDANADQADADADSIGDVCDPTPNGNPTGPTGSFNYYHLTGDAGWGHFKLGNNSSNLWGPKISPAAGQTHLRLTLNGFNETDWNEFAITTDGTSDKVVLGDHISGNQNGWFTVDIPLSAFPSDAFTNIANISVPFSRGASTINMGVAAVEFVGGANSFIWFGNPNNIDNAYDAQWDVTPSTDSSGPTGPTDSDNDGVDDADDNCPTVANAGQQDNDNDGTGNACDSTPNGPDADGDTVTDTLDNCPNNANTDQADNDNDGLGNVCDSTPNGPIVVITDTDGDTIPDGDDNCPTVANTNQADSDGDGTGDACDDSGPVTPSTVIRVNAGGAQVTDLAGNVWSADTNFNTGNEASRVTAIANTTNDEIYNTERWDADTAPELKYEFNVANGSYTVNLHFAELVFNTIGQRVFNASIEGAQVLSNYDIRAQAGYRTADIKSFNTEVTDGILSIEFQHAVENPKISAIEIISGTGNPVEPTDSDGDGIPDVTDNCPNTANPGQTDTDGDNIGDVCDEPTTPTDSDNDGVSNDNDNCPSVSNSDQADSNNNGIGDACDNSNNSSSGNTFGDFAGVNIFPDTPDGPIEVFENFRLYLPSAHFAEFAASSTDLAFNPTDGWIGNLDAILTRLNADGKDIMPVIEYTPHFLRNGRHEREVPIASPLDSNLVANWEAYREMCFQIAARYGSANPAGASVRAGNTAVTGLNLIKRIEPWNEAYQWWQGSFRDYVKPNGEIESRRAGDFSPEEEAAMMTACQDGAKAADPNMQTSSPGTTGWDRHLLARGAEYNADINNGEYPAEDHVVNIYWNPTQANFDRNYNEWKSDAAHPEALGGMQEFMAEAKNTLNSHYPNANLVIGEFGYDTNGSHLSVPGTANTSVDKMQAQWNVRAYLAMFAAGVEKAYIFMIRSGNGDGVFESMGLTTPNYGARLNWYYTAGTIEILREAKFVADIDTGSTGVKGHQMTDEAGNTYYVLWSPTADDSETDYVLNLGTNHGSVVEKKLNDGSFAGGWNSTPIVDVIGNSGTQQITVRVTETPTFIVVAPN